MWGNGRVECLDVGIGFHGVCVFFWVAAWMLDFFHCALCFFLAGKLLVNGFFSLQNVGKAEDWGII